MCVKIKSNKTYPVVRIKVGGKHEHGKVRFVCAPQGYSKIVE